VYRYICLHPFAIFSGRRVDQEDGAPPFWTVFETPSLALLPPTHVRSETGELLDPRAERLLQPRLRFFGRGAAARRFRWRNYRSAPNDFQDFMQDRMFDHVIVFYGGFHDPRALIQQGSALIIDSASIVVIDNRTFYQAPNTTSDRLFSAEMAAAFRQIRYAVNAALLTGESFVVCLLRTEDEEGDFLDITQFFSLEDSMFYSALGDVSRDYRHTFPLRERVLAPIFAPHSASFRSSLLPYSLTSEFVSIVRRLAEDDLEVVENVDALPELFDNNDENPLSFQPPLDLRLLQFRFLYHGVYPTLHIRVDDEDYDPYAPVVLDDGCAAYELGVQAATWQATYEREREAVDARAAARLNIKIFCSRLYYDALLAQRLPPPPSRPSWLRVHQRVLAITPDFARHLYFGPRIVGLVPLYMENLQLDGTVSAETYHAWFNNDFEVDRLFDANALDSVLGSTRFLFFHSRSELMRLSHRAHPRFLFYRFDYYASGRFLNIYVGRQGGLPISPSRVILPRYNALWSVYNYCGAVTLARS